MTKKMELLVWALMLLGLGAIVLGVYGVVSAPKTVDGSTLVRPVTAADWKRGGTGTKAVIVEYSDFQCPACKYYYGMLKQLESEEDGRLEVIYRHYPLQQHQFSKIAAIAAEAAGKQGKFWEMHDMLFERQEEWSKSENIAQSMVAYATIIGLNIGQFQIDVQSASLSERVEQSIAEGVAQKIEGTPTFFLNGVRTEFKSYADMKTAVEKAING